jgi:hypothetical protein
VPGSRLPRTPASRLGPLPSPRKRSLRKLASKN